MTADDEKLRALAESWDVNAPAWVQAVREGRIESRRAVTDRAILDAVRARRPARVLDVGCGEGWLARALAGPGVEVVGIDASEPLVDAARKAGPGEYHAVGYAEFAADPRRFGAFDAVVCNFALLDAYVAGPLGACGSALGAGGVVFVQTVHPPTACGDAPCVDGWRTERFEAFGGAFPAPMPWYFRTTGSWLAAFREAGLEVLRVGEPRASAGSPPSSLLVEAALAAS